MRVAQPKVGRIDTRSDANYTEVPHHADQLRWCSHPPMDHGRVECMWCNDVKVLYDVNTDAVGLSVSNTRHHIFNGEYLSWGGGWPISNMLIPPRIHGFRFTHTVYDRPIPPNAR
eukprot:1309285-Amphidinium_carterae.1